MLNSTLVIAFVLLSLLLPCATMAQGSWDHVDRLPVYADLLAVDMVDQALIVAVGRNGVIRRSVDSGTSWNTIESPTRADFRGVSFVHPVAGVAVGTGGMIVRTIDAGASWTDRPSGTSADLNGVASVKDTIVAVGAEGTMLRSLDWSASWVVLPTITSVDLYAIRFVDGSETGVAVGDGGVVLRSDDAGATWRVMREGEEDFRAVSLLDSLNWFVVADGGEMIVSDDGGESWTSRPISSDYRYAALHMFDSLEGFSLGLGMVSGYEEPLPRYTNDGGLTWDDFGTALLWLNGGLDFIDSVRGALVGDDGTIVLQRENQGGAALRIGFKPRPVQYGEIAFNGVDEGIVVGNVIDVIEKEQRLVRRDRTDITPDGSDFLPYPMNDVAPIDPNGTWIAVGDSGAVLRRTADDSLWHTIELSPETRFVDVAFHNELVGAIVGLPTRIFITDDGGLRWEGVSAPAESVTQIFWWNDTTLAAYSRADNSIHSYSIPQGQWSAARPLGTELIRRIDRVDAQTAFGFGGYRSPQNQGDRRNDLVVRTTDGGETWTTLLDEETGGSSFGLMSGDFWDRRYGVAVGTNGKVIATRDGGETWEVVEVPTEIFPPLTALVDVVMTGPGSGMIVSSNGDVGGSLIARFTFDVSAIDDPSDRLNNLDLTAYPNPTNGGTIRVRWEGGVLAGGLIATADGRIIGRVDAGMRSGDEIEVTMPELPSGVYHLLLRSEEGTREVPIIVTR